MKFNRKLLSGLLLVVMLMTTLMPVASAAELKATYEKPSYYAIATTAYSRMLLFRSGVVVAANEAGKYGLIDATGTVKVPFQYDGLEYLGGNLYITSKLTADGYDSTQGLIDSTGKEVLPTTARLIEVQNGIIRVLDTDGKSTYYTVDMKPSTEDAFDDRENSDSNQDDAYYWTEDLGNGYYSGHGEDGAALLDSAKKVVIPAGQYSFFRNVSSEGQPAMFSVTNEQEQSGVLAATDKTVIPFGDYDYLGGFNAKNQIAVVTYDRDKDFNMINLKSTLYDVKGAVVKTWTDREINTETYYRDLVFSMDGKHYGTMDATGKVLIPNQFLTMYQENGTEKMIVDAENTADPDSWYNLKGVYTLDGKELIAPKYAELKVMGGDRYRLFDGTNYGVMSADSGKTIIPFSYESITVFSRDFLYLEGAGGDSVVTADNKPVVPVSTDGVAVFNDGYTIDRTLERYDGMRMEDNYNSTILPFVTKTATGYTTTYANYRTGEVLGTLPYMASNITSDGRFVYRGDNGLMGYGTLTSGGLNNPAAPASGAGAPTGGGTTGTTTGNVAYATTGYQIQVDGKAVGFDLYALKDANGNDTNYIKLRDVAHQLNGTKAQFNVGWDGAINLLPGAAYEPNGTEMSTPFSGNQSYKSSDSAITIDGEKTDLSAILLTDASGNGFTYFKLRDLGEALGFNVFYDGAQGIIVINTNEAYSAD